MIKIDGEIYNVPVINIKRTADFLDKFATRVESGDLYRELIGVYFNYQLQIGSTLDVYEYARLWKKLTEKKEFHEVTVPDEEGEYTFTAYFASISDELRKCSGKTNYWKNLTVNFIAKSPVGSDVI